MQILNQKISCQVAMFSQRYSSMFIYTEAQPEKKNLSGPQAPNPISWNPNPKNPIQDSKPKTQTTVNEKKV